MRLWVNLDDFPRIGHHRKDSIETINVCRNNVEVECFGPSHERLLRAVMLFIHTKMYQTVLWI